MTAMWGIHNDALGAELVEKGFISIGWDEVGDIRAIGNDRSSLKAAVTRTYPGSKPGAFPVWAGVLHRFAYEIEEGDLVVAPYKADGTINFGRVVGGYEYHAEERVHRHRRRVEWLRTGVARGLFPQSALYEIGSAVTLFRIRRHEHIFQEFLATPDEEAFEAAATAVEDAATGAVDAEPDDGLAPTPAEEEPNADRIQQHTQDFIVRTLHRSLTHEQFELFTADLLRVMGYQARTTSYSQDGGVDVIAHKDRLGLEAPLIKVQCKHTTVSQGAPQVQQLVGTLSRGEVGLFVALGTYTRDAQAVERMRQDLRLLSGSDIANLVLNHYEALPIRWRDVIKLRRVYVVDLPPEEQ
ncbi:restriction endonuclease [Arsenicicoccus sp. MKL-02]|uniref:Restriction endonuclease n=1 Tax=Arsenicicoccus cauae TaxID=2663847 RepID=A0A6I3IVY4_9MICO|nr:restriction endonuclease [Arsenicicoccus cauae]MTB72481.1 restriction endonuclease [Arsenicicoccus cauae]